MAPLSAMIPVLFSTIREFPVHEFWFVDDELLTHRPAPKAARFRPLKR
jgi:hypothetical protein